MIDTLAASFGVEPVCTELSVPVSTYYARKRRERDPSPRRRADAREEGLAGVVRGRRHLTTAHRARHAMAHVPQRLPRAATIHGCPGCQSRLPGEQRCEECNLFCRSLGPGGECPCCDEPISVAELLGHT